MDLYLFRHGIAEDGGPGHPDAARQLTEEGRKKTAAVAKMARAADVSPTLILSSPYDRAVQTARIASDELGYKGEIVQTKALEPHSSPEAVWNEIRDHAHGGNQETSILLAGHEPLLSHLTAWLLGAPSLQIEMKKSTLIRIEVDVVRAVPRGVLRWMVTPALTGK